MTYIFDDKIRYDNSPNIDAFGRLRVSTPLTLFDSSHRYRDNGLWATSTSAGATSVFNQNEGLIHMTVNSTTNAEIIRETTKVFSYQPGKSLLVLTTFVPGEPQTGIRQRIGYFGASNGIYFQLDGTTASFVERSSVTGALQETVVPQSQWNIDKLDGTGPSGVVLNKSKAQIFWLDIEWLGLGTVRAGFVIDGNFIHCHSFHHANLITSTYITTASLPVRYELKNSGGATGATLKQVCSSVLSEGGYELRGLQQSVATPIDSPIALTAANTYYPIISIRLKSDRLDAIVILTALSLMGGSASAYQWQIRANATTSGSSWISAGQDSSVEYKLDGGTISGGRILASGFFNNTQQSSVTVDILKEALFKFQLERDGLTSTSQELTIVCSTDKAASTLFASIDWEEISR